MMIFVVLALGFVSHIAKTDILNLDWKIIDLFKEFLDSTKLVQQSNCQR